MKSFKDYYGNDWRNVMATKSNINEMLEKIKLGRHDVKSVDDIKLINENRVVVIASTTRRGDENIYKMAIDIISGKPTWDQMMDMTFNIGADADKKIVLYDNSGYQIFADDVSLEEEVAFSFAQIVNHYLNKTILATVTLPEEQDDDAIQYSIISENEEFGNVIEKYDGREPSLPSKERFEYVNFWAIRYCSIFADNTGHLEFLLTDKPNEWFEFNPYENLKWDSDGFRLELDYFENNPELCQKYWDKNGDDLMGLLAGVTAELIIENDVPKKIIMKIADISFQELLKLSDEEQEYYAELAYDTTMGFQRNFDSSTIALEENL